MLHRSRSSTPALAAIGVLALSLAFAACSSGGTNAPSGGASTPPGETATASSGASQSSGASAGGSFDISSLDTILKSKSNLDSYQAETTGTNFTAEMKDFKMVAIVVRKGDVSESELLYENNVLKFGVVYITSANSGWTNEDGKTWKRVPLPSATQMLSFFSFSDPGVVLAAILTDKVKPHLKLVGVESKNGQQATHLTVDVGSLPAEASFPPDGQADLWISADGKYLVAATFSGTEKGQKATFDYEVTHVNDPSLKVVPPV